MFSKDGPKEMLDSKIFKVVLQNAPLVSIDLCLVYRGQLLLGKRTNEPIKDQWFTPGGRIHKNESWQAALERIAATELGLMVPNLAHCELMGVWDHFYPNSVFDEEISTHYVNLPHSIVFQSKPSISGDAQHHNFVWFDLDEILKNGSFHRYVRDYANHLKVRDN
jgi:colanic acid biosynthesis protein WcaH